ncbi:Wzz/FepE/Etk N-terminal domain-containing protein [Gammaproteobacteria bacterium]|nr:Wzz/FepE/Etk N-terminal domain-containing protein [Gammaproteobacteria bacterium]
MEKKTTLQSQYNPVEISLLLWKNKNFIITFSSFFTLLAIIFSLFLTPIFQSSMLLKPKISSEDGLSGALSKIVGVSQLTGSLGLGSGNKEIAIAVQTLKSKDFLMFLLKDHQFKIDLLAYKKYDSKAKKNIYDKRVYDAKTQKLLAPINIYSAHSKFVNNHFSVVKLKPDDFVRIVVEHPSPLIAKEWADLIFQSINLYRSKEDYEENNRISDYINRELARTRILELQKVLAKIAQSTIQKKMIAEISDNYVFDVIESAYIPVQRIRPSRTFIVVISAFFFGFIACFIVLLLNIFNKFLNIKVFEYEIAVPKK